MSAHRRGSHRRQLILISIDGLWPGLYASGDPQTSRYLQSLARRGTMARRARPVFPTLTYTNHATLATGMYSDKHGIQTNVLFDPNHVKDWVKGESKEWILSSDHFLVPTLWDLATERRLEAALIRWPSTVGAKARWLIPDIFPIFEKKSVWRLMEENSTPELIEALKRSPGFSPPDDSHEALDELSFRVALYLLRHSPPDLLMLHFTSLDHETHEHGKHSTGVARALEAIGRHINELVAAADPARATFFVFGDHGFIEFDRRVHVNTLFVERGWIKTEGWNITDWSAIAHTQCCVAPVYVRDRVNAADVLAHLKERSGEAFRVIEREELRLEHAFPDAFCAIEANPGYSLGQNLSGPLIEQLRSTRGEHGYSLLHPEMFTGFFALGAGIPSGRTIKEVRLIDVAPTAASFLGLDLEKTDGSALDFRLRLPGHPLGLVSE